jgi:hypothetical protein
MHRWNGDGVLTDAEPARLERLEGNARGVESAEGEEKLAATPRPPTYAAFSRPFARQRIGILIAEMRKAAVAADPFLRNCGLDLRSFLRDPDLHAAQMLAWGLLIAARRLRHSAAEFERIALEFELHILDEEADERLAAAAKRTPAG